KHAIDDDDTEVENEARNIEDGSDDAASEVNVSSPDGKCELDENENDDDATHSHDESELHESSDNESQDTVDTHEIDDDDPEVDDDTRNIEDGSQEDVVTEDKVPKK